MLPLKQFHLRELIKRDAKFAHTPATFEELMGLAGKLSKYEDELNSDRNKTLMLTMIRDMLKNMLSHVVTGGKHGYRHSDENDQQR